MSAMQGGQATEGEVTRLVVAYNSAEALAWQTANSAPLPTLLVDNASADDTLARARRLGLRTLALPANIGFGRAVMAGLAEVESEFALIVNPDAAADAAAVAALLEAARRYPECDLFVPRIVDEEGAVFFRCETCFEPRQRHREPPQGDACVPVISGAAMLVRVAPFRAFGGFDPNIFLYFEEDELCFRYRAARRPIIYVPEAGILHLRDGSSQPDRGTSRLKDVSFGWSLAYVMGRHGRGSRGAVLAAMAGKIPAYLLFGRWGRARRQWRRVAGFLAALRGRPAPFMPPAG
ncbi:glycosyltransferase [Afifella pfennigii]|uniref:glycosyltransferase n=1 Tax=Afifella pfennigii TaxID=209897 RepID=UPI00068EE402|nr:glycosyltransferase [Afifella pfennigii]